MVDRVSTAFDKLTPREREILRLIAAHLQSKEIARALGLSPKTVEMHVLSARRRLSGMSRRDAALAFVAWEGGDPGNDYRKRPDDLAELSEPSLPDREIGNEHDRRAIGQRDDQPTQEPGVFRSELGFLAEPPGAVGTDAGVGRAGARYGVGRAESSGPWRGALQDLVVGLGDDGVPSRRSPARRDWRHDLTNLQWLGLVLGLTTLIAVCLAVIAIGVHEFIVAIQHITRR